MGDPRFVTVSHNDTESPVAVLQVLASPQLIATTDGRLLVRYLDAHSHPGCRPLYPHEFASWRADCGLHDVSAQPVPGTTWADLDPLEFVRLCRLVDENRKA